MKNIYVFDMGHVILKPARLKEMYIEAEVACDYDSFKNLFYNSEYSTSVYNGEIDDNTFFSIIKKLTNSKKTVDELKNLYLKYKDSIYEDTINIIRYLKDTNNIVCLLSNLKEIDYLYLKDVMDMNLFDKIYLSYRMGTSKPNKKIFNDVINDLGTNNFYFFDDTLDNINTANSLGIKSYNITGDNIKECFNKQKIYK